MTLVYFIIFLHAVIMASEPNISGIRIQILWGQLVLNQVRLNAGFEELDVLSEKKSPSNPSH